MIIRENSVKTISVLSCGGTICAKASDPKNIIDYEIEEKNAQEVLDSALSAVDSSKIRVNKVKNILNVDSKDMGFNELLILARAVHQERESSDAIVIMHGTDSLESSAFFLDLVTDSSKPIIMCGAMRPINALGFDGAMNLANAINIASYLSYLKDYTRHYGVLVTMNNKIYLARETNKRDGYNINAFGAEYGGWRVGDVINYKPKFHSPIPRSKKARFEINNINEMANTCVIYADNSINSLFLETLITKNRMKGIVFAGIGAGSLPIGTEEAIEKVRKKFPKIVFVRSSFACGTIIDEKLDLIPSIDLNPQKAKILLSLCITFKIHHSRIQNAFERICSGV